MSSKMKLRQRLIEQRLRNESIISNNQFGFTLGRSSMEVIHIMERLVEHARSKPVDLQMIFIGLFKTYESSKRHNLVSLK